MIEDAKKVKGAAASGLVVDLHPDRPEYRGLMAGEAQFSLPADPSFEEIKLLARLLRRARRRIRFWIICSSFLERSQGKLHMKMASAMASDILDLRTNGSKMN
jgi:hypothetical protein